MRPQLIIDCGGHVLSAVLVTAEGELVPCSQEIRHVAARHVSTALLFDPRVSEHPDFIWDDALETLAKASSRDFFQRARRLGLRRPWDAQATADLLPLVSPVSVLSSIAALADRVAGPILPRVTAAVLDALLDPMFAFLAERRLAPHEVDALLIVPANAGRAVRVVLQKLLRRRGFRGATLVPREIAAAMALIDQPPAECVVVDATDDDLHLHRVAIDGDVGQRRFRTSASATVSDFGRRYWVGRVAAALRTAPSSAFERALAALITGSPETVDVRLTHGGLQSALGDAWVSRERGEVAMRLLGAIDVGALPMLFNGEIFALEAVQRAFGATSNTMVPPTEQAIHGIATAMWWLRAEASRGLTFARGGTLRLDTWQSDTTELVPRVHLPAPGETCHVETGFRIAGDTADQPFLLHLLWGADAAAKGNETLCAVPLALGRGGDELRVAVQLHRGRSGRRVQGTVEARRPRGTVIARTQFTEELEVRK